MALPTRKLSSYQLPLGTNVHTNTPLSLRAEWLRTGLHIIGPTGCGKSMFLFALFQWLTKIPNATIIVFDPKGGLYRMARDWTMLRGLTKRLVLFDMAEPEVTINYSNLTPNGQPITTQAKFARESFRSAWGQSSFDDTPQLARLLFLCLVVARTLELGLEEALRLLRPGSDVRKLALAQLPRSYIREALTYLDSLPERRQEELAASTLARLEPFVADPLINRVISARSASLDLSAVLEAHQILLVNLEHYRPLLPDDARLLGRMLLNDVIAKTFERDERAQHAPVFLIADEVQEIATRDLCAALDRGRGLGLCTILAHQHCAQLMEEDKTGYLFHSVMNDARIKIVFGGSSVHDLEHYLTKELLLDQFDPWTIKDEIYSLECEPVEETRESITKSTSRSRGCGLSFPYAEAEGESTTTTYGVTESASYGTSESDSVAVTKGTSKGESLERGISTTTTDSWAETVSQADHWSESEGEGEAFSTSESDSSSSGTNSAFGIGVATDGEGNATHSFNYGVGWNSQSGVARSTGRSSSTFSSRAQGGSTGQAHTWGGSESRTVSASRGEQYTESKSETTGKTTGTNQEFGQSLSQSLGTTTSKTITRGITPSISEERGESVAKTIQPFHAYNKRRVVSSRTFLTEQEFLTLGLQKIKEQPRGHFLIKVPGKRAVFARAPFVREPRITARQLAAARERIFAQPYYTRIEATAVEPAPPLALPYQGESNHADHSIHRDPRKPRKPKTPASS